ncbi:MAG: hypothetical protein IJS93_03510 [Clostridia bacterium]|nr:hypothetical protein [Clostridia bacterium]
MIERFKCSKEDFEDYLNEQNQDFENTTVWNTLQGKSEYGSTKGEKGYQRIAALKARLTAKKLGLNEERAAFYTKCLGSAFPAFGKEGEKRIEEYALSHELPFDEVELYSSVIEESLDSSGGFVFEGLREILLELFDKTKDSVIKEVELAKLYHEQMEILKIFDSISKEKYVEGEKFLDEEIEKNIDKIGIIGCKKQLIDYKKGIKAEIPSMTKEEKERYYKALDNYKEAFGDEFLIKFVLHEENKFSM